MLLHISMLVKYINKTLVLVINVYEGKIFGILK